MRIESRSKQFEKVPGVLMIITWCSGEKTLDVQKIIVVRCKGPFIERAGETQLSKLFTNVSDPLSPQVPPSACFYIYYIYMYYGLYYELIH